MREVEPVIKTNAQKLGEMYRRGTVTESMLTTAVNKGKITADEFKEIVGSLPVSADVDTVKTAKVIATKEDLEVFLVEHPLTWVDGNQYSVTAEKQSLLTSQLALYQTATVAGQPYELKWNATGQECVVWTYENLCALALAIDEYVQPLVSYQQRKESEIMGCETIEEVMAVVVDYNEVLTPATEEVAE